MTTIQTQDGRFNKTQTCFLWLAPRVCGPKACQGGEINGREARRWCPQGGEKGRLGWPKKERKREKGRTLAGDINKEERKNEHSQVVSKRKKEKEQTNRTLTDVHKE